MPIPLFLYSLTLAPPTSLGDLLFLSSHWILHPTWTYSQRDYGKAVAHVVTWVTFPIDCLSSNTGWVQSIFPRKWLNGLHTQAREHTQTHSPWPKRKDCFGVCVQVCVPVQVYMCASLSTCVCALLNLHWAQVDGQGHFTLMLQH